MIDQRMAIRVAQSGMRESGMTGVTFEDAETLVARILANWDAVCERYGKRAQDELDVVYYCAKDYAKRANGSE